MKNFTPLPSSTSTLDFLLNRPHARLLNASTILYYSLMTTRKADEADLPRERSGERAVRPRIGNTSTTTSDAPTQQPVNPPAVTTTATVTPSEALTLPTTIANPTADTTPSPAAGGTQAPEDTDAEMKVLDILTYVHLPRPDPLQIHGWDTTKALENISATQVNKWNNAEGPKALIYKAHGGKFKKDSAEETIQLRKLIQDFLMTTKTPIIATPVPDNEKAKKEDPPFCALVRGLPQEHIDELVNKVSHTTYLPPPENTPTPPQRFLSSAEITIFIIPYDPAPSSFVTTLKGFLFVDENDIQSETAVSQIVTSTIFSDDGSSDLPNTIRRFVARNRDNIEDTIVNIDDALRFIRSSIRVKRLNLLKKDDIDTGLGKPSPVWNIYLFPPTTDQIAIREWRDIIRKTKFVTDVNNAGRTVKLFNCTVCHSEDHPAGMCPYPAQPGWTAPPPIPNAIPPAVATTSNPVQHTNDARTTTRRGRGGQSNTRSRNASHRKSRVNTRA